MHIHTHIHTLMHTHTLQEHLSPLRELNACLISFLSLLLLSIFAFLYPPHHSALHPFPCRRYCSEINLLYSQHLLSLLAPCATSLF